ncbi:uncharacterized protein LOC126687921 [Mercurialis annua]|uniref:uncharacterized protein LOC126687921 n=1 Tax=Mercurialis annua TaxID=3986 RepID=UPI002160A057|nr:uncharacterized protein LOC126687921 [Mercurialis annua]
MTDNDYNSSDNEYQRSETKDFGGGGIDYSDRFNVGYGFDTDVEAISWAKSIAIGIGFELVILSHKNEGRRKLLRCARGERYRGSFTDSDSFVRKNTKTNACQCKFKIVVKLGKTAWFVLREPGISSTHNHALAVYPEGYRQMSGLSDEAKEIVRDMSAAQEKPCSIMAALKEKKYHLTTLQEGKCTTTERI